MWPFGKSFQANPSEAITSLSVKVPRWPGELVAYLSGPTVQPQAVPEVPPLIKKHELPRSGPLILDDDEKAAVESQLSYWADRWANELKGLMYTRHFVDTQRRGFICSALDQLAQDRLKVADYKGAALTCAKAIAIEPEDPIIWRRAAEINARYGDSVRAIRLLGKADALANKYGLGESVWLELVAEVQAIITAYQPRPACTTPPTLAGASVTFLVKWGTEGEGDGQFEFPIGVAVDKAGNVYVADASNDRIQKFSSHGAFLDKWGSQGEGDGQFSWPTNVAVDSKSNVYVVDTGNYRIQKFSPEGAFLAKWGAQGSGDGQFEFFSAENGAHGAVTADTEGNVYVADTENHRIQSFSPEGTFLAKWGTLGDRDGQFKYPVGVTVDLKGNVYVTDKGNSRVQKFTPQGAFLAAWGSWGEGDGKFNEPRGVAVDVSGNVYVADSFNDRIQKFSPEGAFQAKWGSQGSGEGQFDYPYGVAVHGSGNIYVVEKGNCRVQKFG